MIWLNQPFPTQVPQRSTRLVPTETYLTRHLGKYLSPDSRKRRSERDDKDVTRQDPGRLVMAEYHAHSIVGFKVILCALTAVASQAQPPALNKPM